MMLTLNLDQVVSSDPEEVKRGRQEAIDHFLKSLEDQEGEVHGIFPLSDYLRDHPSLEEAMANGRISFRRHS